MISPNDLKAFIEQAKAETSQLKSAYLVFEEEEIREQISGLSRANNQLPTLIAVLPSFLREGDSDFSFWSNYLMFLVLDKFDNGSLSSKAKLDKMQVVHEATLAFVKFLDAQREANCSILQKWGGKIVVDPEYNIADCNGYSVLIKTE